LIDLVTGTITYASAGHPPPLLVSEDGAVRELDDATTMLIGLRKGHQGRPTTVKITHGDSVVLYTDGIIEAGRDVIAGSRSLREAAAKFATPATLHPAELIKRQIIPNGSADDIAMLVVRTDFCKVEQYIERWHFDVGDSHAAGDTRGKFVRSLELRGFSTNACANAEIVFGELIGNVVRHAYAAGDIEVALNHGSPAVTVLHVIDRGGGFNHISRLPRDPYAENGRGLFLIAALTEDFTVSERPNGGSHARAVLARRGA
jgi:anti-sigma regulatory factor (Ser/Thr protein kinase)